jgi:hypothetical protein
VPTSESDFASLPVKIFDASFIAPAARKLPVHKLLNTGHGQIVDADLSGYLDLSP